MSTERFVAALSEYKLNATEIADILWLVLRQPPDEVEIKSEPISDTEQPQDMLPPMESDTSAADHSNIDESEQGGDSEDDESKFNVASDILSANLPSKALPISVPDAGVLEETLPLVRALKPILKQIDSETARYIDETATVDRIAETNVWSPVMQTEREPWFEVALVIDDNAAMRLWQRLIQDIQRLLRCYGSFRDFRVWKLDVTNGDVGICAVPDQTVRRPRTLLSPDSRRLVLVFSDCTADYWWDGTFQPVLALWGKSMPTTVWQVLPDWMWRRTALGVGEYVAIRNRIPGATNSDLNPTYLSLRPAKRLLSRMKGESRLDQTSSPSVCLPVITTESESIYDWSRMLAGDRRQSSPGFVLPAKDLNQVSDRPTNEPAEQLEQFRLRATPEARRLAALLSAAPVITLPVMRLIRASNLLSGTSPLPVAEVFLGGLLQRAPDQPADQKDPELVQYIFPEETRDRLLDVLPKFEAIEVIEAVSQHIAEKLNVTLADFRALLLSPDLKEEADQYGLKTFAQMTAQILRKLGYADLANQFDPTPEPPDPDSKNEIDWPDFPLETFEYEVAEYLNIPPLESFDFIDAQFEDTDFPPLEADEFTVITVEVQRTKPLQELKPFDFIVATLIRDGNDWRTQRQRQTAYRLIEKLGGSSFWGGITKRLGLPRNGDNCNLEMIAIPGGIFLMGSPEDETNRSSSESPQHKVTIAPFYMSRYPINQAQWRCVAAMPQIERKLQPNPSRFKGDNHPVKQISWYDAEEFCTRLSAHSGRQYRLPTEAEWEYACRAKTTTPFHFGETITEELASYSRSYQEGTTPVEQYGIANGFGLSDMHGNVLEWCQDHWHKNYEGAPDDGSAWIEGGDSSRRVLRGGSWHSLPGYCRSASRFRDVPENDYVTFGFRVCCSPPRAL